MRLKLHPSWTAPVPVEELATAVNIVEFRELEGDSFEGALLTDANKQKGVILYKGGVRIERRRFTIAHELGHFLMPSHNGNQQCTAADLRESRRDSDHHRREAEANRFATGLLMPKPWFSRDLDRLGNADVAHVMELAKHYCTSLEATSNRYCELTADVCAFVFAKENVIRYVRRSANFPRLCVSAGGRLPTGSSTLLGSSLPLRTASAWSEVDGSVWLETERGKRAPTILEQTMRQSDGFQTSLLFIAPDEVADEEDGEIEKKLGGRVSASLTNLQYDKGHYHIYEEFAAGTEAPTLSGGFLRRRFARSRIF